ncbi:MAG: helix-turn-helix domain-containing protein [Solirubrobacteraceae bacterium]
MVLKSENTLEIENLFGLNFQTKQIHFNEVVYFFKINNISNFTDTIFKKVDKQFIQFYFCTSGKLVLSYSYDSYERKVFIEQEQTFVLHDSGKEWNLGLNLTPGAEIYVFGLSFQYISRIFMKNKLAIGTLNNLVSGLFYYKGNITSKIKSILFELEDIDVIDQMKIEYLNAKLQELFILYLSKINEEQIQCPVRKNNPDLLKIKKAHDILMQNLLHPPSKKELAQKVNLSEYKLSKGFKEFYGNNLYEFVLNEKLELGKEILESSNKKIGEVAQEIGYENASHFIAAFKKKYGFTPKKIIKK